MKKTMLIIITLLLALIIMIVCFVTGLENVKRKSPDKEQTEEKSIYLEEVVKEETDDAVSGVSKPENKKENEKIVHDDEKAGVVLGEESSEDENKETWYRVRKSSGDASSQIGAFKSLDKAKTLAKERKEEGYKVFDGNTVIYEP